jgi:hypothetical protein
MQEKPYARGALYPQALLLGIIVNFVLFTPSPSIAIDVLGVAAVILAIRATADTFSRTEQVIWILVAVVLCAIEIHAVSKDQSDREAQEDARRWQDDFNRKQERRQFAALIESGGRLLREQRRSSRETLNHLTGGDTWASFIVIPNVPIGAPPTYELLMDVRGDYPLRAFSASIRIDVPGAVYNSQGMVLRGGIGEGLMHIDNIVPLLTNVNVLLVGRQSLMGIRVGIGKYLIQMYSENGIVDEFLELGSDGRCAVEHYRVVRPGNVNVGLKEKVLIDSVGALTLSRTTR